MLAAPSLEPFTGAWTPGRLSRVSTSALLSIRRTGGDHAKPGGDGGDDGAESEKPEDAVADDTDGSVVGAMQEVSEG